MYRLGQQEQHNDSVHQIAEQSNDYFWQIEACGLVQCNVVITNNS